MSQPARRGGTALNRVQLVAAFELAADEIRRAIAMGRYTAGDRLPNERELSGQLGVSRATLREATRALAAEGLLEVRRGAHGGIRVAGRVEQNKTEVRTALRRTATEVDSILDLRVALESEAARLSASRRQARDLQSMQGAFDRMQAVFDAGRMEAVSEFWRADADFHDAIAASTGNWRMVAAVENARVEFFQSIGPVFSQIDPHAHDGHQEMLSAIANANAEGAATAAREHIEVTRTVFHEIAGVRPGRPSVRRR